jgi:protein-S-isoprenylcysteine O-methyltransferase Ste14
LTDLLAIATIMFWPVIPIFWIPVHFATTFFKKLGFFTYVMPLFIWLPWAYLIYQNRVPLLNFKIDLPAVLSIVGFPFLILGLLLHIRTARLLGLWGIIGLPEISSRIKENLMTGGPFSIVRHPTYLAHTLIFSGIFLITEVIAIGIITILDLIITTANFSIKTVNQWLLAVIPGLTRNPEVIENAGFPIKEFGNDEKIRCSIIINAIIIPLEEKELLSRFGEDYELYRKKVPSRFFPLIHL